MLNDADLRQTWEAELAAMRDRIKEMRHALVDLLQAKVPDRDFSFVRQQRGMFSYSGLTAQQVERLKSDHAIYAVSTGRICVAALNRRNVGIVADAIATVIRA